MSQIKVSFVTAALGLGGTEKGVVSYATRLDRTRFSPRVVTLVEGGARERTLRAADVPVALGCADEQALARELEGSEVVHVFRHGIAEPMVPAAARRAGVPVLIESNIFGSRDRSPDEAAFSSHLFISMMCLLRYRGKATTHEDFLARHRVLYLPLEADRLRSGAPESREARKALGLDPDRPVVSRLGRAVDLKWRDLLVDMLPRLLKLVPEVQVVFVGTTPAKRERLVRRRMIDRVKLFDPVSEDRELATLYAASDVVLNASTIGESQGLVIAEAMSLGIPVVTCSTPWVDNAQVEFVENGVNGWVANHPAEFAEATADLLLNPGRRAEFGQQGRRVVGARLDPVELTRQLEALYEHHLRGGELAWSPSAEEIARFEREYPRRSGASFRSLSARERAEASVIRLRETATRRSSSFQMVADATRRRLARR